MPYCTKCGRQLDAGATCPVCFPAKQPFDPYSGAGPQNGRPVQPGPQYPPQPGMQPGPGVGAKKNAGGIDIGAISDMTEKSVAKVAGPLYERDKPIVPDCIAANDGEIPVKQYNVAKMRTPLLLARAECRMQITNKRLILRAVGRGITGRTELHQEFRIGEIGGVDIRKRYVFSPLALLTGILETLIFGGIGFGLATAAVRNDSGLGFWKVMAIIFFILATLFCMATEALMIMKKFEDKYYMPRQGLLAIPVGALWAYSVLSFGGDDTFFVFAIIASVVAGINLFLLSFPPDLLIEIKTKGGVPGVTVKRDEPIAMLSWLFGGQSADNSGSGYMEVLSWKDTSLAIKEVGTIIDDLQTIGDRAIEKWKV